MTPRPATAQFRSVVTYVTAAEPQRWRSIGVAHTRALRTHEDFNDLADRLAEHLGLAAPGLAVIDVQTIDPTDASGEPT